MQFSIAKLLLVTLFINFVVAASFAFPQAIGFPLVTFVALFVIPPFIIVGAVNTRGLRQSFFLGAMVAGVPHFIISAYFAIMMGFTLSGDVAWSDFSEFESTLSYLHLIGFLIGAIGGVSGMASYYFLTFKPKNVPKPQPSLHGSAIEPRGAETPLDPETPMSKEPVSNSETKSSQSLESPRPR